MIVLDTNVISEAMRGAAADARVMSWLRGLDEVPVTTVINRAEIMAGVALLPEGAGRSRLQEAAVTAFNGLGVCLPLVPECAAAYGDIVATRQSLGRPIGAMDALIAATARVADAVVATRDLSDFEDLGLALINPWEA